MKLKRIFYPLIAFFFLGMTAELAANPKQKPTTKPPPSRVVQQVRAVQPAAARPVQSSLVKGAAPTKPIATVTGPAVVKTPSVVGQVPAASKPVIRVPTAAVKPVAMPVAKPIVTAQAKMPSPASMKPIRQTETARPQNPVMKQSTDLQTGRGFVPSQNTERLSNRAGLLNGPFNQTLAGKLGVQNGTQELADRFKDPTGRNGSVATGSIRDQQLQQNNQRWQDFQSGLQNELNRNGVGNLYGNRTNSQGSTGSVDARINQWKQLNRPTDENRNGPFNPLPGNLGSGPPLVGGKTPAQLSQEANQRGYNVGAPGLEQMTNGGSGLMQNPRNQWASSSKEFEECVNSKMQYGAGLGLSIGGALGAVIGGAATKSPAGLKAGAEAGALGGTIAGTGAGALYGHIVCEDKPPVVNSGQGTSGQTGGQAGSQGTAGQSGGQSTPTTGGTTTSTTGGTPGTTPSTETKKRPAEGRNQDYANADPAEINRAIQTRYGDGLRQPGEMRKGASQPDLDKLIQRTAALMGSKINPNPHSQPEVGGGPVRGNPLTGDPVEGQTNGSGGGPKGPKPEVNGGLGIPGGRGPGGPGGPGGPR